MTPQEVRNEIYKRYLAVYAGIFPIALDSKKFTPPEIPAKYVRLTVKFNEGFQSTLGRPGNRKFMKTGIVFIQVFTPDGKGTDENDELTHDSVNVFDGVRIGQLWLYNGRITSPGSDGKYYQQNGAVEFEFEEIR